MNDVDISKLKLDLPEEQPMGRGRRKSSPIWRWLIFVIVVGVLILVGLLIYERYLGEEIPLVEVALVAKAKAQDASITFSAGGWVEPVFPWPITVSSLIDGRIEELLVYEGVPVKKGQLVAVLYKKDLEDKLNKARAELAVKEANLVKLLAGYRIEEVAQAKAEYDRALVQEQLKQRVYERSKSLLKAGAISEEQLEKDESEYKIAQAIRTKAQKNHELLKSGYRKEDIDMAKAEVAQVRSQETLAESQLAYTEITSPVDGKILELYVTQGSFVTANKSHIVSIYDPKEIQIRIDIRQNDRTKAKLGQDVEVFTDVRKEKPYQGKVIRIDPRANLAKDTIEAKIKITNPDDLLHPEMTATVNFLAGAVEELSTKRLLVPRSAIILEGTKQYVFILRNTKVYKIPVVTGGTVLDKIEIISGLNPRERVVVSNLDELSNGAKVKAKR